MMKIMNSQTKRTANNQLRHDLGVSRSSRAALAKMITNLFDLWKVSTQEQLYLLGLSETSRKSLTLYRKSNPIANKRDLMDRAANLLAIHQSLRILFHRNRDIVYKWPTIPNRAFGGQTPVELIGSKGFLGLLIVRRYLDFKREQ